MMNMQKISNFDEKASHYFFEVSYFICKLKFIDVFYDDSTKKRKERLVLDLFLVFHFEHLYCTSRVCKSRKQTAGVGTFMLLLS